MKFADVPAADRAKLIASAHADADALKAANQTRIRESGLSAHAQSVVDQCLGLYTVAAAVTGNMLLMVLGEEQSLASRLLYELAAANIQSIEDSTARACEPYAAKERS
jgi:hypothetical protein